MRASGVGSSGPTPGTPPSDVPVSPLRRSRRTTAWKWVSLGLVVVLLLTLPVTALNWFGGAFRQALQGAPEPTDAAWAGSLPVLLLGFLGALGTWIVGCVRQRDPRPQRSRHTFIVASALVAVTMLGAAVPWLPVARQALHQADLVTDLARLNRLLPTGYHLRWSENDTGIGSRFVEPERVWSASPGTAPCNELGAVLTRWAGKQVSRQGAPAKYDTCSFDTTRYDWDIAIEVDLDAQNYYPHGTARIELTSEA